MNSAQRLAIARALATNEPHCVMDLCDIYHVCPASHVKEGKPVWTAQPTAVLDYAPVYRSITAARLHAEANARNYGIPQSVWALPDGGFISCAKGIDVQLWCLDAQEVGCDN